MTEAPPTGPGAAWTATAAEVELAVACGPDRHRLVWRRGEVVLADHPDLAAERAEQSLQYFMKLILRDANVRQLDVIAHSERGAFGQADVLAHEVERLILPGRQRVNCHRIGASKVSATAVRRHDFPMTTPAEVR